MWILTDLQVFWETYQWLVESGELHEVWCKDSFLVALDDRWLLWNQPQSVLLETKQHAVSCGQINFSQINFHGAQLTASMTMGISLTLVFSITSYTREKWTQSRKSIKIKMTQIKRFTHSYIVFIWVFLSKYCAIWVMCKLWTCIFLL